MSIYTRLDRIVADQDRLERKFDALANSPQAQRTSIEAGTMDVNDEDGNLVSTIGFQEDGSGATRFFDGPIPPVPAGFTALADGPIIQGTWDGSFVDGAEATYDLAYLEVAATLVDDDSRVSFATITAKEGASAAVVANQTGEWAVAVRSVSQAGKKSEFFSAGTVEVKITDLSGAIEAVQDSANGKNRVTYSSHAPTPTDEGIFDDTWFVGQVGRPEDLVEATNYATNPSLEASATDWSPYSWTGSGVRTQGQGAFGDWFYRLTATATMTDAKGRYHDVPAPVKSGETWTVSIHVRPSRAITMQAQGEFRNSAGAVGPVTQAGPSIACPANQWTRIHLTLTAIGDATTIRFQNYLRSATLQSGDTLDLDGEVIALGELKLYFDGDTTSGITDNESHYRWSGTPHASTSVKYLPALDIGESDAWNVIEQYRHDGTGWVRVELSHYVFSTVDLGKATVGELDGIRIMSKTIGTEQLRADFADFVVARGGTWLTSDGTGEWSDAGFFIRKPDGTSLVRFPTDGSPLSLTASDVQIDRASIAELDLVDGNVRSGGVFTLRSGVTPPASPPELSSAWQRVAKLPKPDSKYSHDWTGLAVWENVNGKSWVRTVNVLGSPGDDARDVIELYDFDTGVFERAIQIDNNPRHGVAVIGDVAYVLGPDRVPRPGVEKNWVHGFDLNTGARVTRWEFDRVVRNKHAISTDGTNLLVSTVGADKNLYLHKWNPATGSKVGPDATTPWGLGYTDDLEGIVLDGTTLWVSHRKNVRTYTYSGSSLTRKNPDTLGWRNPDSDGAGLASVGSDLFAVTSNGGVYQASGFMGDDTTIQACSTWWDGVNETTPSPVAAVHVPSREAVTVSLPKRAGLQKRLYLRRGTSGTWNRITLGENVTSYLETSGALGLYSLPTTSTFPNATPAILKSVNGNIEFRGDGSGKVGPLTFNADGSMTSTQIPAWIPVTTFAAGFGPQTFGNVPSYRVWPDGKVEWKGIVSGPSSTSGKPMLTIPPAALATYVPWSAPANADANGIGSVRLDINDPNAPGVIRWVPKSGSVTWASLDGIYYHLT